MKPYQALSEAGRIRRLHGLARTALHHYPFDVARLRCIARDTNTTFRVDTTDGQTFALRVASDPDDTTHDLATELAWLRALEQVSEIDAVSVLSTRDGDGFVEVDHPGVPGSRECVVFSWVPGRTVGDDATSEDYFRLGELAARLHDHGERWPLPADLRPLVWDRIFYYPTEPVVLYEDRYRQHLTPHRRKVVEAVEAKAANELSRLHREVPVSVLHGDLHPWNVHTHRTRLIVFDFEDLMIGAPVQDIATTLFYNRDHPGYADLCAAFEAGYRTLRLWPVEWEGQLELIMAARTVSFINYVLRMDLDVDEHIPRMTKRIERVL